MRPGAARSTRASERLRGGNVYLCYPYDLTSRQSDRPLATCAAQSDTSMGIEMSAATRMPSVSPSFRGCELPDGALRRATHPDTADAELLLLALALLALFVCLVKESATGRLGRWRRRICADLCRRVSVGSAIAAAQRTW